MAPSFAVVIEEDADGWLFGTVPELPGCYTQARTMEELREKIREAIVAYIAAVPAPPQVRFRGVETIEVPDA